MNKDVMPIDIVNHKFRQGLKGYVQAEVDDFLGGVADAYGKALEQNERLRQALEAAERALGQYRSAEDTIKNALVLAEKTAEQARGCAQEQASLMLREAEHQARELAAAARRERDQIALEVEQLRRERSRFEAEFRALLETYLYLLSSRSGHSAARSDDSPAASSPPDAPPGEERCVSPAESPRQR
jgi:cell division initiation protein